MRACFIQLGYTLFKRCLHGKKLSNTKTGNQAILQKKIHELTSYTVQPISVSLKDEEETFCSILLDFVIQVALPFLN